MRHPAERGALGRPAVWLRVASAVLRTFEKLCAQRDEFLRLIINSIRNDLISRNEAFHCLALGFVGNGARHRLAQARCLKRRTGA